MKKYLLSTLAVLSVCTFAHAEESMMPAHTYGVVQAGMGFGQDEYKEHGIFGLGMGYKYNEYIRSDIIASFRPWGKVHFKEASEKSKVWAIPVLANIYGTIPLYGKADIYAMGGIGYAYNKTDSNADGKGKGSSRFAWNVGAGIDYYINDCWSLDLGYRFTNLGKARLKRAAEGVKSREDLRSHDILLSARYHF